MQNAMQVMHSTRSGSDSHNLGANSLPKPATSLSQRILAVGQTQQKSKQPLDKKVEITQPTQDIAVVSDYIPSRFNHKLTQSYVSATKIAAQQAGNKSCANPRDFNLRCDVVYRLLLLAEIFQKCSKTAPSDAQKAESAQSAAKYLSMAKIECREAKKLNALDARYYQAEAMLMEFEGVDCKNIAQVEKYIHLLQLALAFDPASTETKQTLDQGVAFLRKKWADLKQEGMITDDIYLEWTKKLDTCLGQNALKELFRKEHRLFKFSSNQTHAKFFNAHPELKSVDAFLEMYPETRAIELPNGRLTKEGVRESLAQAEDNPLATELMIVAKAAILTPVVANEIKEGLLNYSAKQKVLRVHVGNEDDATTITNAFKFDNNLIKGKGTLRSDEFKAQKDFISPAVYALFIPLNSPFVKINK